MDNKFIFIEKWKNALEAYETPRNFVDTNYVKFFQNQENPLDIPFRILVAPGYAKRKELMKLQRKISEKRKERALPLRWKNDGCSCFLCDNVGRAEYLGDNLILSFNKFNNYIIVPNRYPALVGHSLICAKNHNENDSSKPFISEEYIETAVNISHKFCLDFMRNHTKSGMSISNHEHLQLQPSLVKTNYGKVHLNALADSNLNITNYGEGIFRISKSRFDTLAFYKEKNFEKFLGVLEKLVHDDVIFTFNYTPQTGKFGAFFLTPQIKEDEKKRIGGGSPLYIHLVSEGEGLKYEEIIEPLIECLPEKGKFNWDKYFE